MFDALDFIPLFFALGNYFCFYVQEGFINSDNKLDRPVAGSSKLLWNMYYVQNDASDSKDVRENIHFW